MSQLPESSTATFPLTVQTGDSQSEVLVLDGKGRLLTRGVGPECTFQLEPGIYRVKVLTGTASQEKPVVLNADRTLQFGQLDFPSAVPLAGTSTSHEYHMLAADQESRKVHVHAGAGSSLFFLVRNWTAPGSQSTQRVTNHPAEGLSLYAADPSGDRNICDLDTAGTTNSTGDPWSACTIAVNPGVYELQLALPSGEILRHPVVASTGWQTQSFLFVRQYVGNKGTDWRADLGRTSVLLTGIEGGFNANEATLRVAELARQRLARRTLDEIGDDPSRPLLPDEMRKLLREKFYNPMLGIYAAHLMLLERSFDVALFRDVVGNLRSMLPEHPDVEALALRANLLPIPGVFDHPPMLARSWFLITDCSVDRPELVSEWLAQRSVGNVMTQGAWHVLRGLSASDTSDLEAPSALRYQQAMAPAQDASEEVAASGSEEGITSGSVGSTESSMSETVSQAGMPSDDLQLTELESAVAEALGLGKTIRWSEMQRIQKTESSVPQGTTENIEEDLDSSRVRSLATRFGIPGPQVKGVLSGLEKKLNSNPRLPNLSVRYK